MDATIERERDRIMARLRRHYAERTVLPMPAGSTHHANCPVLTELTAPCRCVGQTLTLAQLQRLMRDVVAEYGVDA